MAQVQESFFVGFAETRNKMLVTGAHSVSFLRICTQETCVFVSIKYPAVLWTC